MVQCKGESFTRNDNKVELLLNIPLEYKVNKRPENITSHPQCSAKVDAHLSGYL